MHGIDEKGIHRLRNSISPDGLYDDARTEHDACGVGFVVRLDGPPTHKIIQQGIQLLENLEHRGACGCDPETGDGCGILVQTPHNFFLEEAEHLKFNLPKRGDYGVGMLFLPSAQPNLDTCIGIINAVIAKEGQSVLGWRKVPCDSSQIGFLAKESEPDIRQVFIQRSPDLDAEAFERKLYVIRKAIEHAVRASDIQQKDMFYVPSMSARTIVYKGLMLPGRLRAYYPDLADGRFESRLALAHQRYSTNTFPKWPLAHPFRYIAHNGEINTLRGNINMMASREAHLASPLFGSDANRLAPILQAGYSDSAMLDNAFELLVRGGRSVEHAMMMLIPEPWSGHESMSDEKKAFYEYHACLMEPWDGPASIAFTDGIRIGAVLDRNGLRPSRYWMTSDNFVVMASEVGVLDIPQDKIIKKGRLEPGRMFFIDTEEHRIVDDAEIKQELSMRRPYRSWLNAHRVSLPKSGAPAAKAADETPLLERQQVFGYSQEDLDVILAPMAKDGKEPIGSMGNDAPLAVLSSRPQLLFNYFKQLFAQVTNPPIDSIREELVMSLETTIGRERNLLGETPEHAEQLHLLSPILTNDQLDYIKTLDRPGLKSSVISTLFPVAGGPSSLGDALDRICAEASKAIADGATLLVLSDRGVNAAQAPIPSLLATGAVHEHLVREHTRTECGLVVESGEPREVMHFCLLAGFGAGAVNPYLAFETIDDLSRREIITEDAPGKGQKNFVKSVEKGLLKVMSKIGISTLHSYRNAQIFEAVGLSSELVNRCFTGTVSRVEGIGVEEVAIETLMRHELAYPPHAVRARTLDPGGQYKWRKRGEYHMYNPDTIAKLQHATKTNSWERYKEFSAVVDDRNRTFAQLRGC